MSEFKILTDNQVWPRFFSRSSIRRRKSIQLDFLSQFDIAQLTLVKGEFHVLAYALLRASQIVSANNLHNSDSSSQETSDKQFCSIFFEKDNQGQMVNSIYKALHRKLPPDGV